jgi:hypothetical protein
MVFFHSPENIGAYIVTHMRSSLMAHNVGIKLLSVDEIPPP